MGQATLRRVATRRMPDCCGRGPASAGRRCTQFLVIGYDGSDGEALQRRLRVRQAHIDLGDELVASGNMLYGVAILDHDQRLIGSMLVVGFPSRAELDVWLEVEPYVTGEVWKQISVQPCRVGPRSQGWVPTRPTLSSRRAPAHEDGTTSQGPVPISSGG